MPVPTFSVECTRNRVIARDIYELSFKKPEGFTFKAGQFVLFDVPLVGNPTDIQPRAYSIASSPDEDELLFVLKWIPTGRTSRWVAEELKVGMKVTMKGPFGNFVLHGSDKELLFVATGTGIAPFRSQLLSLAADRYPHRMDLVFGVRNEEDIFWQDELTRLGQKCEHLFVHFALSQPSEDWTGHKGRVQTLIPEIVRDFANKKLYICGSPPMTKELKQLALDRWGMKKEDLHAEAYI